MKNFLMMVAVLSVTSLLAADNPYSSYEQAMASAKADPMAVEWHNANAEAIEDATDASVLADFVSDAESAKALLDQLKPAYETDPLVMTQIAAVTQWVMLPEPCGLCFWKPSPAAGRKVWVAALEAKIAAEKDGYVRTVCQQQLDLCK